MKHNILTYSCSKVSVIAIAFLFGCLPIKNDSGSVSKGITAETLDAEHTELKPKFNYLYDFKDENKSVKMSVFITYDNFEYRDLDRITAMASDTSAPQEIQAEGKGLLERMDPASGHDQTDYAAHAFADIKSWLAGDKELKGWVTEDVVVTDDPENKPGTYRATIRGRGPGIDRENQGGNMDWEIHLRLGLVGDLAFAEELGEALATNHITMLNGHFYPGDASRAITAVEGADNGSTTSNGDFASGVQNKTRSKLYEPAIAKFLEVAKQMDPADMPYRIAAINGCGSEFIEDLVFGAEKQLNEHYATTLADEESRQVVASEMEMIGIREYSNYRHFGGQIARFMRSLVAGERWSEVVKTFDFAALEDQKKLDEAGIEPYGGTGPDRGVKPVFRSQSIGVVADGQASF